MGSGDKPKDLGGSGGESGCCGTIGEVLADGSTAWGISRLLSTNPATVNTAATAIAMAANCHLEILRERPLNLRLRTIAGNTPDYE